MGPVRPSRAPALAPSLALLWGVRIGLTGLAPGGPTVALVPLALFAAGCEGSRIPRAVAVVIASALGVILGSSSADRAELRTLDWLGGPHGSREAHWRLVVSASPETDVEGASILRARGRPEDRPQGGTLDVRVRIRPASPSTRDGKVLDLRAGDTIRAWGRGSMPAQAGNRGAPDPRLAARARGIDVYLTVKSARLVEHLGRPRTDPTIALDGIRRWLRKRLGRIAHGDPRLESLLHALLLGEREGIDRDTWRSMRDGGVVHVLAISGLHVGLLVGVLGCVVGRLPAPGRAILLGVVLVVLPVLVGPRPAVLRATVLAGAAVVARAVGRDTATLNVLGFTAAALATHEPTVVVDVGFRLSFSAVGALVVIAPRVARGLPLPSLPARGVAASFSAYVGTLPAVANAFGRAAPISIGSNLVAVPLCAGTLLAALAAVGVLDVPFAGHAAAGATRWFARSLLATGGVAAAVGGSGRTVWPPTPAAVVVLVLCAHALARGTATGPRLRTCVVAVIASCAALHLGPAPTSRSTAGSFVLLDVGQGQSSFVDVGRGRCAVLDVAGSYSPRFDPGERIVLPALLRAGCRRIALLVLSHPHLDHAGGAEALYEGLPVDAIAVPPGGMRQPVYRALADRTRSGGGATILVARGSHLTLGALRIEVLHPDLDDHDLGTNDRSIVTRLLGEGPSVLVVGDLERPGEDRILDRGTDVGASVLVVGHHGSDDATSPRFLDAVAPSEAWISVGANNRFGHPAPSVVRRLRASGAAVRRTDRDGALVTSIGSAHADRDRHERDHEQPQQPQRDETAGPVEGNVGIE